MSTISLHMHALYELLVEWSKNSKALKISHSPSHGRFLREKFHSAYVVKAEGCMKLAHRFVAIHTITSMLV